MMYAKRDTEAQGEHYLRHLDAMYTEGLHKKSDIAAELAHRDIELDRLRKMLTDYTLAQEVARRCNDPNHDTRYCQTCESRLDGIDAYQQEVQRRMKEGAK